MQVLAERIGAGARDRRDVAAVARGGDGHVGRAAAEELAERGHLAQRDADLLRIDVDADPAHRDDVEAHHPACSRSHSRFATCSAAARSKSPSQVGQHAVLFDDHPAVVVAQCRAERGEVDVAVAERAEHAAPPRGERVGPLGLDRGDDVQPRVLDVDGADPVAPVGEGGQRVAAGDEQMAGVEQQRHVGVLEEALDLRHTLDVRRRVVVEDRLVAALARDVRGARDAVDERRQRASSSASSAPAPGFATRSGPPASHSTGRAPSRLGRVEQVERLVQAREVALALAERDRHEPADQLQVAEVVGQRVDVPEIAGRPEVRAGVARRARSRPARARSPVRGSRSRPSSRTPRS